MIQTIQATALEYAVHGWRIVPLHNPTGDPERPCSCGRADCDKPGKHPRIYAWPENASTDSRVINRWWAQWPKANVGIACGAETNLWVMDVDGDTGREELHRLQRSFGTDLPITPRSLTGGGGEHYLFQYEPGLSNEVRFAPGLDIRTEGGLIVAPPSVHVSGALYEWDAYSDPKEVPVAAAPAWLLDLGRKAGRKSSPPSAAATPEAILTGSRNATLWTNGCAMRRRGMSEKEIFAALSVANQERCQPPLLEEDIQDLARRAARYDPAPEEVEISVNGKKPTPSVEGIPEVVGFTASELMRMRLEPARYAIDGYVCEGLNIFAGGQKKGKSWLAYGWAIAIASGGIAMGEIEVEKGSVLYLALEDGPRRLKDRLISLLNGADPPADLHLYYRWPAADAGGIVCIEEWLDHHPDARMVVIDTMGRFRSTRSKGGDVFQQDYDFGARLKRLADDHRIALVILHHLSKRQCEDPFDQVSGTIAVTASADATLLLQRQRGKDDAQLFVTGRDVEEREMALMWSRETCQWTLSGTADEFKQSAARKAIIELLRQQGAMKPSAVAEELGKNRNTTKNLMLKMAEKNEIRGDGGLYWVSSPEQ